MPARAASLHHGRSRTIPTRASSSATRAGTLSAISISKMRPADALPPTCSPRTRRGGWWRTSRSCRNAAATVARDGKLLIGCRCCCLGMPRRSCDQIKQHAPDRIAVAACDLGCRQAHSHLEWRVCRSEPTLPAPKLPARMDRRLRSSLRLPMGLQQARL